MLQDYSSHGIRDETGLVVITLQEGQEKKVSFRINFRKHHRNILISQVVMQARQAAMTRAKLSGLAQGTGTKQVGI